MTHSYIKMLRIYISSRTARNKTKWYLNIHTEYFPWDFSSTVFSYAMQHCPSWSRSHTCYPIHPYFLLGLFFDHEDGGDMSSETSVDFQWTTPRYIPEKRTLHDHSCENLKSENFFLFSFLFNSGYIISAFLYNLVIGPIGIQRGWLPLTHGCGVIQSVTVYGSRSWPLTTATRISTSVQQCHVLRFARDL
jgi:hypothetical protein